MYLAELYLPATAVGALDGARAAARRLDAPDGSVRCIQSIFVPSDETCFLLFQAASQAAVRAVTRRAGLALTRIVEAVA